MLKYPILDLFYKDKYEELSLTEDELKSMIRIAYDVPLNKDIVIDYIEKSKSPDGYYKEGAYDIGCRIISKED